MVSQFDSVDMSDLKYNRRKKMETKEYAYSLDEDIWGDYEEIMDGEIAGVYTLYKGEVERLSHANFLAVDVMIDGMKEEAYALVDNYADDYLEELTSADHRRLQKVITDWLDENAKKPEFHTIGKVTKGFVVVGTEV